jgi:hypothetical protein
MVSPMSLKEGLQRAERLHVGAGPHMLVAVRIVTPLMSRTGTTERSKRPSSQAAAARRWLSTAKASHRRGRSRIRWR